MNYENIKVTTTLDFLDGSDIQIIGPITAHVVVGMNVFKDMLFGLTDIFGGKSKSFQKTLSKINEEVIKELKKTCQNVGGNCILGLKIDNDEISAQGKSMLMVTAIGTAAISDLKKDKTSPNVITSDFVKENIMKADYIDKFKESKRSGGIIDDKFWDLIIRNGYEEFAETLLKYYDRISIDMSNEQKQSYLDNYSHYIQSINYTKSIEVLYTNLLNTKKSDAENALTNIIENLGYVNYDMISDLIKHQDLHKKKIALKLASLIKSTFNYEDIGKIIKLQKTINESFVIRAEEIQKESKLSKKIKDIWICTCGTENNKDQKYCKRCYNDIYGFRENELHFKDVSAHLDRIKEVLEYAFTKT